MPVVDDEPFHIEQQQADPLSHQSELRRIPSTESLRAKVNQSIITIPDGHDFRTVKFKPQDRKSRVIRFSTRLLLESKPQDVKDEEENIKKILHEQLARHKQIKYHSRSQSRTQTKPPSTSNDSSDVSDYPSSASSTSQPTSSAHPSHSHSTSPIHPRKKIDLIINKFDNLRLEFINTGYDDVPSPKRDSWFKTEAEDSPSDLVIKVEGHRLPSEPKLLAQKSINLLEKGVDSLGRRLDSIKRQTHSLIGSPHLRSTSNTPLTSPVMINGHLPPRTFQSLPSFTSATFPAITTTCTSSDTEMSHTSPSTSLHTSLVSRSSSFSLDEYRNRSKFVEVPDVIPEHEESSYDPHTETQGNHLLEILSSRPSLETRPDVITDLSTRDSLTYDEEDVTKPPQLGRDHRRIPLSVVTKDLRSPSIDPHQLHPSNRLTSHQMSSKAINGSNDSTNLATESNDSKSVHDAIELVHLRPLESRDRDLLPSSSTPKFLGTPGPPTHQRTLTAESNLSVITTNTSHSTIVSNVDSHSMGHQPSPYQRRTAIEDTSTPSLDTKVDRKGKGVLRHQTSDSVSHSPLLTDRANEFVSRRFSKHLAHRLRGRVTPTTHRGKRPTNREFEAEVLEIYRQALEDDDQPNLSASNQIPRQVSSTKGVKFETDVLIQNQGGVSFFGRENFNERLRSKPWQTIKLVKQYQRPGHWDSAYTDDPPQPKIVSVDYISKETDPSFAETSCNSFLFYVSQSDSLHHSYLSFTDASMELGHRFRG